MFEIAKTDVAVVTKQTSNGFFFVAVIYMKTTFTPWFIGFADQALSVLLGEHGGVRTEGKFTACGQLKEVFHGLPFTCSGMG